MRSRKPVRLKRGWRRHHADPAAIGPFLRGAGFIGCAHDPVEVIVCFDGADRMRRITASYPDGWRCYLTLHLDDTTTVTQSISIRVQGRRPEA